MTVSLTRCSVFSSERAIPSRLYPDQLGNEIMDNIDVASVLIKVAAADGAVFISLPEVSLFRTRH